MNDLDIIAQLEQRIGMQLSLLKELNIFSRGYQLNHQKQVTALHLFDCELETLPIEVTQLENLTQFSLVPMLQRGNAYRVAPATIYLCVMNSVELYILIILAAGATELRIPTLEHGNESKLFIRKEFFKFIENDEYDTLYLGRQ